MPKYKTSSQDYKALIAQHHIEKLYHFTDRDNLESIIQHGGLYSWSYCRQHGINIPMPGGDDVSRSLDSRDGLQNYVRLSLCKDHPMKYVAMNEGRINNPVLLEIDPEVIYWQGTKYADRNATKNGAKVGDGLSDFEAIHFDKVKANTHFDLDEETRMFYQAEIMVVERIPLEYILNIKDYGGKVATPQVSHQLSHRQAYTAQITRQTPTAFIFLVDQSVSMGRTTMLHNERMSLSEAVARIVNRSIEELINRCIKGNEIRHYFDIAVIGYGETTRSAWLGTLEGKDFVTPSELRGQPYRMVTTREEKRTRRGTELKEVQRAQWIEANHTESCTRLHEAMRYAQRLLTEWTAKHQGQLCYPPTIINITDGEYNGISDTDIEQIANELKSIETIDGNALFFNIHISPSGEEATFFPESAQRLNPTAQKLYDLSSLLPLRYNQSIHSLLSVEASADVRKRGMVINADMSSLIKVLEIGTPTNISNL